MLGIAGSRYKTEKGNLLKYSHYAQYFIALSWLFKYEVT
jgi:hypothetical protein